MPAIRPDWLGRLAREPLVHFVIIGALLFAVDRWRDGSGDVSTEVFDPRGDTATIIVSAEVQARLVERFRERQGREPSDEEERAVLDRHVDDEVKYREALALGLERGDPVIRRRLIQRLEFLAEDLAQAPDPDDDALRRYMSEHIARYQTPERITGEHVFVRRERHARIPDIRRALAAGAAPETLGDPFVQRRQFSLASRARLAATMGDAFAAVVMDLPVGVWSQAIESSYGFHVVRLSERVAPGLPDLDEIRPTVLNHFRERARASATRKILADIRARYRVRYPDSLARQPQ